MSIRMKRLARRVAGATLLLFLAATGLSIWMDRALIASRFALAKREASGQIILVAIDAPSIARIGVWPWPRDIHARLIDALQDADASEIYFDVDFSSSSTPTADAAFAEALERAGGSVVLPSFQQVVQGQTGSHIHTSHPLPDFARRSWAAAVNVAIDSDGLSRRYPTGLMLDATYLPSMGAMIAGDHSVKGDDFLIDFGIRADTIPQISLIDVLNREPAAMARLKDKKVVIGATAIELGDRFSVPGGDVVAGPVLQILAAESLLTGRALTATPRLLDWGFAALALTIMAWLRRRWSVRKLALACLTIALLSEASAILIQTWTPFVAGTAMIHITMAICLMLIAVDEIDIRGLIGQISELRFQHIAKSLGDALICLDSRGRIYIWNSGAVKTFGYLAEEVMGKAFCDLDLMTTSQTSTSDFDPLRPHLSATLPEGLLELTGYRKPREAFPVEVTFSSWRGADGRHIGLLARDVTERHKREEHIRFLAQYDTLTGLPNRNTLLATLNETSAEGLGTPAEAALLVVGVHNIQLVATMGGHALADKVLVAICDVLRTCAADTRMIARIGSDEFAILVAGPQSCEKALTIARLLTDWFAQRPVVVGTYQQSIDLRIGIAERSSDDTATDDLLGNARLALVQATAPEQNNFVLFRPEFRDNLAARVQLEAEVVRASHQQEFELYYQPQVDLATRQVIGAEALIRWNHPTRGVVPPGGFIAVVNTSTVADDVARWVIETACRQARVWEQRGQRIRMGINLAPSLVQSGTLVPTVARILSETGVSPDLVELEVTEDILLADDAKALEMFGQLQRLGVGVVFDDFGTGFAGLSYLKRFPLDGLKIDRSFVMDLLTDKGDNAIVSSIITMAKALQMSVIAEGIEDEATAEGLAALGCPEGQGYYFGRPMTAAQFETAIGLAQVA